MTVDQVMAKERQALMTEYLLPAGIGENSISVPPYTAVPDIQTLTNTPLGLRTRHPVRVELLRNRPITEAFVQVCPSLEYKFLWVQSRNEWYRADYVAFLRQFHNMNVQDLPTTRHVDHLFNRARAAGMFIRTVLLPGWVNTSHGGGYEGRRTRSGVGSSERQRSIDEISLMKLWNIRSPRKNTPLTPDMEAHIDRMAALFGMPREEIERNIRELMEVASFEPSG
jgi:hypothetical protein